VLHRAAPGRSGVYFSSFIALHTSVVCPVFESITVVAGTQVQVTVLAFSCLTTTQCSMRSAVGGGNWLRMGGGVGATGCFFAAQPAKSRQNRSPAFLMFSVFARGRALVDGDLGYSWRRGHAGLGAVEAGSLRSLDGRMRPSPHEHCGYFRSTFTSRLWATKAHVSDISSINLVMDLPAPWPALVSMRIRMGAGPA
jgi:hypothetical protein